MSTLKFNKWQSTDGVTRNAVLQVVQSESSIITAVVSTSYTDSGLSGSITPTSATSKILVIVSQTLTLDRSASDVGGSLQILRNSTVIKDFLQILRIRATGATAVSNEGTFSFVYLDSPATTNPTAYKTQISVTTTANSGQIVAQPFNSISTITLMEIAQ